METEIKQSKAIYEKTFKETSIEEPITDGDQFDPMIRPTGTIPTVAPRTRMEQFVYYKSGVTYRLYFYDLSAGVWRYTALT